MNDEQLFLANAYLDGELTADERRIAETDPDVMAEVEQLREIQAQLRAVDGPSSSARESAIAAAMAEFGRTSTVTTTVTTTTPVPARAPAPIPFRPRPFSARFLAVAAAIVAVGALGVIITQAGGGGDDDFAAEPAAEDVGDAALVESRQPSEDSADAGGDSEGDAAADGALAEPAAESTMEMAEAPTAMSEEMAADAGELAPADETTTLATAPADFDPDDPVTDEFQLGAYGRYLLDEQRTNRLGPTPNTPCPAEFNILGETIYVLDQDPTDVYVAVQETERRVIALDQSTCVPVGEGPLTEPTDG